MISQNKQILSMVAVALAATVTANAQTPSSDLGLGAYVGVQGGLNISTVASHVQDGHGSETKTNQNSVTTYPPTTAGAITTTRADYNTDITNTNWDATTKSSMAGFFGLKLGNTFKSDSIIRPAIELDTYWVQSKLDVTIKKTATNTAKETTTNTRTNSVTNTSNTTTTTPTATDTKTITDSAWNGNYTGNTYVAMINGIARVDLGLFQPYVGMGIGFANFGYTGKTEEKKVTSYYTANTTATTLAATETQPTVKAKDNASASTYLAVQIIAGADYYVTNNISVFGEYKFLNICGDGGRGTLVNGGMNSVRNNLLGVGVRYHF